MKILRCLALSLVLVMCAVPSGCTGDLVRPAARPDHRAHTSCREPQVREQCSTIDVPDGRYALLRATPPTTETVLIDLGGPGLSVLSGQFGLERLAAEQRETLGGRNALVVEEPWVTAQVPDGCAAALDDFGGGLLGATPGSTDLGPCFISAGGEQPRFGFDPVTYRNLVARIEDVEGVEVTGSIAVSFGIARVSYLGNRSWTDSVLWKPYPLGEPLDAMLSARAETIRGWLDAIGVEPSTMTFEQASALVALSYRGEHGFKELAGRLIEAPSDNLDRLFRETWSLYGDHRVSPAFLAYLEETCNLGGDAGTPGESGGDAIAQVFAVTRRACGAVPRWGKWAGPQALASEGWCFVVSDGDAVSPPAMAQEAFGREPTITLGANEAHIDTGGLGLCAGSW
ncbi:MAG TPA: hypothetical protein DEG43_02475 [Acidimicrobiaceae bacterium]|nr:hypothetical protein [Acidimicrobiaceae bacterium]